MSQVFCKLVIRLSLKICLKYCHKVVCESSPRYWFLATVAMWVIFWW